MQNDEFGFKEFIFNNVSASIINSVLAFFFCWICWMVYVTMTVGTSEEVTTVLIYGLIWLAPTLIYNNMRHKANGGGKFFWMSLFIPYVVVGIAFAVYLKYFS